MLPLRWKNPDLNNDGKVDALDLATVNAQWGKVGTNIQADCNYDGIVDNKDWAYVTGYVGQPRPADTDLPLLEEPTPKEYGTLVFTLLKLPWFSVSELKGLVGSALISPLHAVMAVEGWTYNTWTYELSNDKIIVKLVYYRAGSPHPLAPAVIAAIVIGGLVAAGFFLIAIGFIVQNVAEWQKTMTFQDTSNKLAEELEKGLITKEQYEALMAKLMENKDDIDKATDTWGMISTALPLIIGVAVVGAVMGLMPKRRD